MEPTVNFRNNVAYWKNIRLGEIFPSESTFRTVPKSRKNLFRMFGDGIGCNEQLLILLRDLNIEYIEVLFNRKSLLTTTDKWLREGIRSPYASDRVDRQLILPISKINMDRAYSHLSKSKQLSLGVQ